MKKFMIEGKVFRYPGPAGWFFVYLGKKESDRLREERAATKVGWGYIKVRATLGVTSWDTTLFPTKEGPFLLAVKAAVRKKEGVHEGDPVRVECRLL